MKPRYYLFTVLVVCLGCAGAYFLLPAYTDYRKARTEYEELHQDLTDAELETQELQEEIHNLRTDPRAVERVAREKFGWCREHEKIYHFDEPVAEAPPPADTPE